MRHAAKLLAALLTAVLLASLASPASASVGSTVRYVTIEGHEGVPLKAVVITPTGFEGPRPLLVMPSAWATNNLLYVGAAHRLAHTSGYQVVSYTSRGFWDSGGQVEVAGPQDRADASRVIDWALENTDADPDRIGMAGISYGAGISLLTAAEDDRVTAVASLSGWTDLTASLFPGNTVNLQSVEVLLLSANLVGRPGEDLRLMEREYRRGNIQPALDLAEERSAASKVDRLNANGTAVMLAHAWNDGFFPPSQMADFYEALETPKSLMVSPGDHATAEMFGAAGLPNETWEALADWFDHHLRGVDNGVDTADPVRLKPNNGRGDWASYGGWSEAAAQERTYHLGKPSTDWLRWQNSGAMGTEPDTGWEYRIRAGIGTTAQSGTVLLSGAAQQFFDMPTGVYLPAVDRYRAGVWSTDRYAEGVRVAGPPRVGLTITPTAADQSVYLYLYAVDRNGVGSLITHAPHTLRGAVPGAPVSVEARLEPVVWDLPAGHRLVLVADTGDARYADESRIGDRVAFGSPEGAPAYVSVPTA